MHLLIHEPDHRGHRFTTARVLIDALLEIVEEYKEKSDCPVPLQISLATTRSALKCDAFNVQIKPIASQINIIKVPEIGLNANAIKRTLLRLNGLQSAIKHNAIDHVYLPYADGVLQLIAASKYLPGLSIIPSNVVAEALIMQNAFAYPSAARNRRWRALFGVLKSGLNRIHINDPMAWEYIQRKNIANAELIQLIPDPITDTHSYAKLEAKRSLGLPETGRIVGTVGVINSRKGADKLIRAFLSADLLPTDSLLLAGKFVKEIQQQVQEAADDRICCIDRYLSEAELSMALSAMDLVATAYPPVIGSASIVIRACNAGRPVIASNTGFNGFIVPRYNLGHITDINDNQQFALSLQKALDESQQYEQTTAALQFAKFNTEANVRAHFGDLLRTNLGMRSHEKLVPWK